MKKNGAGARVLSPVASVFVECFSLFAHFAFKILFGQAGLQESPRQAPRPPFGLPLASLGLRLASLWTPLAAKLLFRGPKELPTGSQGVPKGIEWGSQGLPKGFQEASERFQSGHTNRGPSSGMFHWLADVPDSLLGRSGEPGVGDQTGQC